MAVFKCKMCGGALEITEGATVAECAFCGTKQTVPRLTDEKRTNLYDRANHFRRIGDYDKAMALYEQILAEDATDAEAYWSIVLCRYGIEYVEDPTTHKRVPTVHRAQYTSILADEDYLSALSHADGYQRDVLESEAKEIDRLQKEILAISKKEKPFDVFICYKETGDDGARTKDSVLAQDLYFALTNEGLKVFFARITLEDKLGSAYEPYIFAALHSAKVMVVLGTKPEHFKAVWVKNEWSRYLSLMREGAQKTLIPAYRDMDPYDLPDDFSHLQALDMSRIGFLQDLVRGIRKMLDGGEDTLTQQTTAASGPAQAPETSTSAIQDAQIPPLIARIHLFFEDGDWRSARAYCERILDIDPRCVDAYFLKLLAMRHCKNAEQLVEAAIPIDNDPGFQRALGFATEEQKKALTDCAARITKRVNEIREQKAERGRKARRKLGKIAIICSSVLLFLSLIALIVVYQVAPVKKDGLLLKRQGGVYTVAGTVDERDAYVIPAKCHGKPVTSIRSLAFYKSAKMTSVVIPDTVKTIGDGAFLECMKLTSVQFGNGVTSIGDQAFYDCIKLTSLSLPSSVEEIGSSAFGFCTMLTRITVAEDNSVYHSVGNCLIETASKTLVLGCKTSVIPSDGSVMRIGEGAFSGCTGLTTVYIPDTVTTIRRQAFENCWGLTSLSIPESVKTIEPGVVEGCSELTTVSFAKLTGWTLSNNGAAGGTPLTVTEDTVNAKNLRDTYAEYYWKCT